MVLGQELREDADKLVVDEADALEGWVLEALDLLLDDDFKGRRSHKEGRGGAARVVEDRADVGVLYCVKGVDGLDAVGEELVEDE